ncbi:MAG: 50S ribosomal protein L32 [Clostridia bacterium]|nr:50S ribosomal protein L32 [Clostridia bacterium]
MAIVPKRKTSKARRNKRRSNVWKLVSPALDKCSKCGNYKLTHRVCRECGFYKERNILFLEA